MPRGTLLQSRNHIAWLQHRDYRDGTECSRFVGLLLLYHKVQRLKPDKCGIGLSVLTDSIDVSWKLWCVKTNLYVALCCQIVDFSWAYFANDAQY